MRMFFHSQHHFTVRIVVGPEGVDGDLWVHSWGDSLWWSRQYALTALA